jgi:3-deoxy-D-manno-octulosonic-acid transferase
LLQKLSAIAAQSELDFERFKNLGVDAKNLSLTGNLKFAVQLPADLVQKGQTWRTQLGQNRLIWVAASTHPVEEEVVLQAHQIISQAFPNALLILVPRHPERFDHVAELCQKEGLNTLRRSLNQPASDQTQIFLGDTMGELLQFYQTANVAFVGGSLVKVGGHSLLEPAAVGVPIIAGPHLFNTTEIAEQLSEVNALIGIVDAQTLSAAVIELFRDETKRQQMINNARSIVIGNQDSLPKTLSIVTKFLQ